MRRYIKLHTVILTNDKVARLASDAARWHYVRCLVAAKLTEPEGRWLNRDYLRRSVGDETFACLDEFLELDLLSEKPDTGEIAVPQWWLWQGSDKVARQADLSDEKQERKRKRWAEQKRRQRAARKQPESVDTDGHVHPNADSGLSTNVHPNRERHTPLMRTADTAVPQASTDALGSVGASRSSDAKAASGEKVCPFCNGPVEPGEAVMRGRDWIGHRDCWHEAGRPLCRECSFALQPTDEGWCKEHRPF